MKQEEIKKRLQEIAETSLQGLEDEAVLAILNERKNLLTELAKLEEQDRKRKEEEQKKKEDEARKQEEQKKKELEKKKQDLITRLAEVNKNITPDQDDEKLIALIQERKMLDAELAVLNADSGKEEAPVQEVVVPKEPKKVAPVEEVTTVEPEPLVEESKAPQEESKEEQVAEDAVSVPAGEKISITKDTAYTAGRHVSQSGRVSGLERSGEQITLDSSLQTMEYQNYLNELKENLNSLGTFLQGLPIEVKRNRAFMLEVAKIDPAYAMHYADKDTLKKDENFNIAVAGMNNQRNTGNPLSEMLPEMRTGQVLLAGVKNDFRNVRFIRPEMAEYEEIMKLAQRGALEAVTSLKNAHDVQFLLPPVLQKDKAFMKEVEKITKAN